MKRITITVDPDDYAAVAHIAKDNDIMMVSWLVRRLMREFLDRGEPEYPLRLAIGRSAKTTTRGAY